MRHRVVLTRIVLLILTVVAYTTAASAAELAASVKEQLATSTYVYIASQRKGGFSKPAEIWFLYHDGAVWVGTPPTSWRVRRIKAGRPTARIAVGKADGPSFEAVGSVVNDPQAQALMLQTYAKKYPDRWPGYEQKFRAGFKDGSRVLVKYTPK